jgi:hypothetical protein
MTLNIFMFPKKSIPVIVIGLWMQSCAVLVAQENNTIPEEVPVKKISEPKDRIIFDINYDGWLNTPAGIKQKPQSPGVNFYCMYDYPFGYGPFSVAFGLGLSSHNVHSNASFSYSIDGKYTSLLPFTIPYKLNKLSCNYLEIPLELRLRTHGKNSFKMAVGAKIGYAYNIHTKIIDADGKRKNYNIKNIDPLRYGVLFRIGYNKFNLQGFYSLTALFKKGKGEPDMIPYSVGIGILLH